MAAKSEEEGLKSKLGRKFSKRASARTPEAPKPKPEASRSATLPPNMDAGAMGIQHAGSTGIFSKLKRRLRLGSSKGKYDLKTSPSPGKARWLRRRSDESQMRRSKESIEDEAADPTLPAPGKPGSAKTPRKTKTDKEEVILIRKDKRVSVICKAENGDAEVIFSNVENSDEDSSSAWGGLEEDPYATISSVRDQINHGDRKLSKTNSSSKSSQSSPDGATGSSKRSTGTTPSKTPDSTDEYPYARIDPSKKKLKQQQQQQAVSLRAKDFNVQVKARIRCRSEPDYETLDEVQQRKSELVDAPASPTSPTGNRAASDSLSRGDGAVSTSENSLDDLDPDYETLEEVQHKQRVLSLHLPAQQNSTANAESVGAAAAGGYEDGYASLNRPKSYTCGAVNRGARSPASNSSLDQLRSFQDGKPKCDAVKSGLSSTSASSTSLAPLAPLAAGVDTSLLNDAGKAEEGEEDAQEDCLYDNPNVILRKQQQQQQNSQLLSTSVGGGGVLGTSPRQSLLLGESLPTPAQHHHHHIKTPAEEELVEKLSSLLAPPLPLRNYHKEEVYQTTGAVLNAAEKSSASSSTSVRHSWSSQSSRHAMTEFLDVAASGTGSSLSPLSQHKRPGRSAVADGRRHSTHSARGYIWGGGGVSPGSRSKSSKQASRESLSSDKGSSHSQENERVFFSCAEIARGYTDQKPRTSSTLESSSKPLEPLEHERMQTVQESKTLSGTENGVSSALKGATSAENQQPDNKINGARSTDSSLSSNGAITDHNLKSDRCESKVKSVNKNQHCRKVVNDSGCLGEELDEAENVKQCHYIENNDKDNEDIQTSFVDRTLKDFTDKTSESENANYLIANGGSEMKERNSDTAVCEKSPTIVYLPCLNENNPQNCTVLSGCQATEDKSPFPKLSLCEGDTSELDNFSQKLAMQVLEEAVSECQNMEQEQEYIIPDWNSDGKFTSKTHLTEVQKCPSAFDPTSSTAPCEQLVRTNMNQKVFDTQSLKGETVVSAGAREQMQTELYNSLQDNEGQDGVKTSVQASELNFTPSLQSLETTTGEMENEVLDSKVIEDCNDCAPSNGNCTVETLAHCVDNEQSQTRCESSGKAELFKAQGARPKVVPLRIPAQAQACCSSSESKGTADAAAAMANNPEAIAGSSRETYHRGESHSQAKTFYRGEEDVNMWEESLSPTFSDVDFCEFLLEKQGMPTNINSGKDLSSMQILNPEGRTRLKMEPELVQETVYQDSDSSDEEGCSGHSSTTEVHKSLVIQVERDFSITKVLCPLVYANPRLLENVISGKFKNHPSCDRDYLNKGVFKWGRFYCYLSLDDKSLVHEKMKRYFHAKCSEFIPAGQNLDSKRQQLMQQTSDKVQVKIEKKLEEIKDLPTFYDVRMRLLKNHSIDSWEPETRRYWDTTGSPDAPLNIMRAFHEHSVRAEGDTASTPEWETSKVESCKGKAEEKSKAPCVHSIRPSPCSNFQSENTCLEEHREDEALSPGQNSVLCQAPVNQMESVLGDFLKLCDRHLSCKRCEDTYESDSEDEIAALDVYVRTVGVRYSRALHGELAYTTTTRPSRHCCASSTGLSSGCVTTVGSCRGGAAHLSWQDWSSMDIHFRKLVPHSSPRLDFQFLLKTYAEFKHFVLKDRVRNYECKGCYMKVFPWHCGSPSEQPHSPLHAEKPNVGPEGVNSPRCCRAEELVFLKLIRDELNHFGRVIQLSPGARTLFIEERDIGLSLLFLLRTVLRNVHKMKHRVQLVKVPAPAVGFPLPQHQNLVTSHFNFHLNNFLRFRADSMSDSLRSWVTPEDYTPDPNILASGRTVIAHTDSRSLELAGMLGVEEPRPLQEGEDFFESMHQLQMKEWYWGPISYEQAAMILQDREDGSFLVRDSSDHKYLLSLSFKSLGEIHHTRIEHAKGLFSFWSQPESHGKARICEFIDKSVQNSRDGRFLYFLRPSARGVPPLPIRLLMPVSRNFRVASLKHLTRFVVRQSVRWDHLDDLPVPEKVKRYLKEKQYYAEIPDGDHWALDGDCSKP